MSESQPSILIVDDDAEDLASVERSLRSLACELVSIKDPHGVLPSVSRLRPAVVILDALLPGLSGFDLCKQIKTDPKLKGTQVLILTGVYLRQQYRQEALQQFKADGFLTKPFRPPELQRLVVQLLSKATRAPRGAGKGAKGKKLGFFDRLFGKAEAEAEAEPTRIVPREPTPPSVAEPPPPELATTEAPGSGEMHSPELSAEREQASVPPSSHEVESSAAEAPSPEPPRESRSESHGANAEAPESVREETEAPLEEVDAEPAPAERADVAEESAVTPSALDELDAAPPVEKEAVNWIEAASKTRELRSDEIPLDIGEMTVPLRTSSPAEPLSPPKPPPPEPPPVEPPPPEPPPVEPPPPEPPPVEPPPAEPTPPEPPEEPQPEEPQPLEPPSATAPKKRGRPQTTDVPVYDEDEFAAELKRELSKCKRVDRPLTLILIRVSDLSQIVELFGREVREPVLWHVAEQAMEALREVDLVGMLSSKSLVAMTAFASDRYGGGRVVSRMRKGVKKKPFPVGEELPPIIPALQFGMATFPMDGADVTSLIKAAEEDLAAK